MYHNVFKGWFFMERMNLRSVCFKGDPSNKVPETEAQRASAEIAMNNYNDYMSTIRPFEEKYIADVTKDPAVREAKVAGMVNADIAQKVGTPSFNPTKGLSPKSVTDLATTTAGAQEAGTQAVGNQRAAGYQGIIDSGMGKASQAQLGMAALAQQSVATATNNAEISTRENDASMSAGASAGGMALGMVKNIYDDNRKK